MARIVESVPQPWLKFMDGNIWELSPSEMGLMPSFRPMTDTRTNMSCGMCMYQWYKGDMYYVRFLTEEQCQEWSVNQAANWTIRKDDNT